MFVVTVTFVVSPERVEKFHEAIMEQAKNSLQLEEECRVFDVCLDASDPGCIFLYEKYDSPESFQIHLESGHFRSFDALVTPWVQNKSVATYIELGQST